MKENEVIQLLNDIQEFKKNAHKKSFQHGVTIKDIKLTINHGKQ